jgi:hypothetical protein
VSTLEVPLHYTRRVVLVRFERATLTGDPDPQFPDIDQRGERDAEHGGVFGVMVGRTVKVDLVRVNVPSRGPHLFVVSSRPAILRIDTPAELPEDSRITLSVTGLGGGADSEDARIEIHIGAIDGPIVGFLIGRVYVERNVDITPHRVQLVHQPPHGAPLVLGAIPVADLALIMEKVRAIWIHYGVTFDVAAEGPVEQVRVANQDHVSDQPFPGELSTVLRSNWTAHTINVYFVDRIGTGGTLGYGLSPTAFAGFGVPHPGILLGDRTGSPRADVMHWANDLAHEIGHFFRLWHVGKKEPPHEIETSWARRQLMHNFNHMRDPDVWPSTNAAGASFQYRPLFHDVGYGDDNRGCMVTMKALPHVQSDNQAATVRATLASPHGPY